MDPGEPFNSDRVHVWNQVINDINIIIKGAKKAAIKGAIECEGVAFEGADIIIYDSKSKINNNNSIIDSKFENLHNLT